MKPIHFKESNKIYGAKQKEYKPIYVFDNGEQVISCWNLSIIERLKIFFTGNVWLSLKMYGKPLTPSFMTTNKTDLLVEE